jgi:hypothetical protein
MHTLDAIRERFPFLGLVAQFDDASLETEQLLTLRNPSKLARLALLVGSLLE